MCTPWPFFVLPDLGLYSLTFAQPTWKDVCGKDEATARLSSHHFQPHLYVMCTPWPFFVLPDLGLYSLTFSLPTWKNVCGKDEATARLSSHHLPPLLLGVLPDLSLYSLTLVCIHRPFPSLPGRMSVGRMRPLRGSALTISSPSWRLYSLTSNLSSNLRWTGSMEPYICIVYC